MALHTDVAGRQVTSPGLLRAQRSQRPCTGLSNGCPAAMAAACAGFFRAICAAGQAREARGPAVRPEGAARLARPRGHCDGLYRSGGGKPRCHASHGRQAARTQVGGEGGMCFLAWSLVACLLAWSCLELACWLGVCLLAQGPLRGQTQAVSEPCIVVGKSALCLGAASVFDRSRCRLLRRRMLCCVCAAGRVSARFRWRRSACSARSCMRTPSSSRRRPVLAACISCHR